MPFLLPRTASVLAAGFLLTGPSAPVVTSASSPTGSLAGSTAASCLAHWTAGQLRLPGSSLPAGLNSKITSVAALSPTDVWALITRTNSHGNNVSAVYHYTGTERYESAGLAGNERSFAAQWIVARSDTNVWVVGSARGALQAWQYNGSRWSDHPPARYSYAAIDTAALDSDGTLYLGGRNARTRKGVILSYDGSRWADLSPANPPSDYEALAVTATGTLIAAGGGRNDGTLQEKSGATWLTVSLSAHVNAISKVSVAPDGSVYGVGSVFGGQLVFIRQPPGSRSASILDPATGSATSFTTDAVALGLDVWALGEDEPHGGWHHSWITHDERDFFAAGRRISQVAAPRSGQTCWSAAASRTGVFIRSLPSSSWCARCGCDGSLSARRGGARQPGCSCSGLSGWQDYPGAPSHWRGFPSGTWPIQGYLPAGGSSLRGHSPPAGSGLKTHLPAVISPPQPARSGIPPRVPRIRSAFHLATSLSTERQARSARSPAGALGLRRATPVGC